MTLDRPLFIASLKVFIANNRVKLVAVHCETGFQDIKSLLVGEILYKSVCSFGKKHDSLDHQIYICL